MTENDFSTQLINVETTLMHQQKAIDELSDMVVKQGKAIDYLLAQNKWLNETLKDLDVVKPLSEETPPPHY